MQFLITFIKRKWAWACLKKLFWANVALILGTLAVIFVWPGPLVGGIPSDLRIRTWGMCLQLLGAYTVWHDVSGTARAFGKGKIFSSTWDWLKSGFITRTHVLTASAALMSSSSSGGRISQRPVMNANNLIEERVSALERYVGFIDIDLNGIRSDISTQRQELSQKMHEQTNELSRQISDQKRRLEEAAAGNYVVLLFGAAWLLVGIVLLSIPVELAKVAAGQASAVWLAF